MVHTPRKKTRIPVNIITPLALFIIVGFVLVAGCSIPTIKNKKATNSSSPTVTPSITATTAAAMQTTVPVHAETTPVIKKGQVSISIGNYDTGLPVPVFVDNVSAGNVSRDVPLNLTTDVGLHAVRICVGGACIQEKILIVSSNPTSVNFEERLKNEIVRGQLSVSSGGYNAELPVFVDNTSVGNVSLGKSLNLMLSEGPHNVKVCVGILCVNETVEIKFAQPVFIDFGERLKTVAEFPTPTIRIVGTQQTNNRVKVDVEFINPGKNDLDMSATIQCTYSYINPADYLRLKDSVQGVVTKSVKAGTRTVQSLDLSLSGGSTYIIEPPVIQDTTSN